MTNQGGLHVTAVIQYPRKMGQEKQVLTKTKSENKNQNRNIDTKLYVGRKILVLLFKYEYLANMVY